MYYSTFPWCTVRTLVRFCGTTYLSCPKTYAIGVHGKTLVLCHACQNLQIRFIVFAVFPLAHKLTSGLILTIRASSHAVQYADASGVSKTGGNVKAAIGRNAEVIDTRHSFWGEISQCNKRNKTQRNHCECRVWLGSIDLFILHILPYQLGYWL